MATPLDDERHERFINEYLMVPRGKRPTLGYMAGELGVTERTLRSWRQRKDILDAWADRTRDGVSSPEHLQAVMSQVLKDATDPNNGRRASAQKLFLEFVKAITPPSPVTVNVGDASGLSDDELKRLIAESATEVAEARKLKLVVNNEYGD